MTPLYCRKCGTRLPTDGLFCPTCGTHQTVNDHAPTNLPEQEHPIIGTGRLPPGRILHQRYRLLHTVGQGGMGAVYVAQDTQLGNRLVAVKEMSMSRLTPQELSHAVEQFRSEAHLLASLHHPNLPAIHEYFSEDDRWYLIMSFIEGQSLQTALDRVPSKKFPLKDALHIGIESCEVLDYLHSHVPQIIFRDLKPSNIMLTPKGRVCLIDFGIARHFKQEQTKDTAYYYSVGYAPPEQYGQSQTSPRSDIYSLGATLHQMLSGQNPASKPFQFSSLQQVDPAIPVPLANLIAQMLEMNEQSRPANVAEVKAQLEQVLMLGQAEPTRKARIKLARPIQDSQLTSKQQPQCSWLKDPRKITWVFFIVLSLLIGWLTPRLVVSQFGEDTSILYLAAGEGIAGIGAAVTGGLFLAKKEGARLNLIGGLALTLFWNLFLLVALFSYNLIPYYNFYPVFTSNALFNMIWLLVGTNFFLRMAKTAGGLAFGIYLILMGVFFRSAIFLLPPFGMGEVIYYEWSWYLFWVPSILVGIVAIIITILKKLQGQRSV